MNDFFVIQVINRIKQKAYVVAVETKEEYSLVENGIDSNIKQFPTTFAADMFIERHAMRRLFVKVNILSNDEFIEEGKKAGFIKAIEPGQVLLYVENSDKQKLCYDAAKGYYFRKCDAGFVIWRNISKQELQRDLLKSGIMGEVLEFDQSPYKNEK